MRVYVYVAYGLPRVENNTGEGSTATGVAAATGSEIGGEKASERERANEASAAA